jgi:hypothetical protein
VKAVRVVRPSTLTLSTRGRGPVGATVVSADDSLLHLPLVGRSERAAFRVGGGRAQYFAFLLLAGSFRLRPLHGLAVAAGPCAHPDGAIISAVGESFAFERVRPSTFEWFAPPDTRYLEISDWKIDDDVTREVTVAACQSA